MKVTSSAFLVAATFLSSHAMADGLRQEVRVPLTGEYDSNPQMVSGGASAYRARVAPQYTLTNVSGANEVALSLGAVIERSSNQAVSQDRNDPNASLGWKHLTPTSEFNLNARYLEESARAAELRQAGVVVSDTTRTTKGVAARWTSLLTERLNYTLGAFYSAITYADNDPVLIDYNTYGGRFTLGYQISSRDEVYWLIDGSRYEPTETGFDSTYYGSMLGFKQRISDTLDWDIRGGWLTIDGQGDESTWQGMLQLNYTGEQSRFDVNVGRIANPTGIYEGFVVSNQARARYSFEFSERTTLGLDGSWIKNMETITYPESTSKIVGAWANYELDQFWSLRLRAERRETDYQSSGNAVGNLVGLTLLYQHPDF